MFISVRSDVLEGKIIEALKTSPRPQVGMTSGEILLSIIHVTGVHYLESDICLRADQLAIRSVISRIEVDNIPRYTLFRRARSLYNELDEEASRFCAIV